MVLVNGVQRVCESTVKLPSAVVWFGLFFDPAPFRTFPGTILLVCQWCCFWFWLPGHRVVPKLAFYFWLAKVLTWEGSSKQHQDGLAAKFALAEIHIDNVKIWQSIIHQIMAVAAFWPLPWIVRRKEHLLGKKGRSVSHISATSCLKIPTWPIYHLWL